MGINCTKTNKVFWLLVCLTLTGCRISFEGKSVVRDDGSMVRMTTIKVQDESDKEEVLSLYELPQGGIWSETPMKVKQSETPEEVDKPVPTYTARKIWTPQQMPGTDYKRYGESRRQSARNEFSVRLKDWWFVRWFEYRERFYDTVDRQNLVKIMDEILKKGLEEFRLQLSTGISDAKMLDQITDELRKKYRPLLIQLVQIFQQTDPSSQEATSLMDELQEAFDTEKTYRYLVKTFPELNSPEKEALIHQAVQVTETLMGEEMEKFEEVLFGVHGMALFQNYDFDIKVVMPGKILESNADEQNGNVLSWQFNQHQMDRAMQARSRLIYPLRLLTVFILCALILLVISMLVRIFKK